MKKALLSFLCGLLAAGGLEAALPARSLVSRLLDAREGFRAPAKEMRFRADPLDDRSDWPFDVARVEALLARALVWSEEGAFRLKTEAPGASGDARARSEAALAYVNRVMAEWAVLQLDAKFARCDAQTVRHLAQYRVDLDADFWKRFAILTKKGLLGGGASGVGGWIAGWKVDGKMFLLLTSDLTAKGCPRDYQFVMWDGRKDWPIAGFDTFPDAPRAHAAMRVTKDPVAASNLAALLFAREANRHVYMPEYLESLLRRAAGDGCEEAFYNLGVLKESQGDLEQARAFFSRESSVE